MQYRRYLSLLLFSIIKIFIPQVQASVILLDVYYPESNLDADYIANFAPVPGTVFGISMTTCQTKQGTEDCPGGEQAFQPEIYSISNITDRVGLNHWRKSFDLGTVYIGDVNVKIIAMQSIGLGSDNRFFVTSSVPQCVSQPGNYQITAQYCEQPGSPYVVSIENTAQVAELVTFPWFGLDGGTVVDGSTSSDFAELSQVYSAELNNSRNISVYIPPSVLQNTVPRVVNIMLMMDGEYGVTYAFAFRGGFELAVVSGVAPESIMIGVPSSSDIFDATPPGPNGPQRTYELTFAKCDPSLMDCNNSGYTVNNTGGTDLLLDWIESTVIPLVLDVVGMLPGGEVSIAGASLGGLTSLYAAGTRPQIYARGWSMEGTTSFNFGQISQKITETYSSTGHHAKAVVMQIGTSAYATFTNPSTGETRNQLNFQMETDSALQSIGVLPATVQCQSSQEVDMPLREYSYVTACDAPDAVVANFLQMNGQHSIQSWITIFSLGLPYLYSSQFSAVNGTYRQRIYSNQYLSSSTPETPSSSSSDDEHMDTVTIVLSVFLFLALLGLAKMSYMYWKLLRETHFKELAGAKVSNPMNL